MILRDKDINNIIAKKLNMSEEAVKENADYIKKRLLEILTDEKEHKVYLHNLGTLYRSPYLVKKRKMKLLKTLGEKSEVYKKAERVYNYFIENHYETFAHKLMRPRIFSRSFTERRNIEQLEKEQNNFYNGY